MASSGNSRTRPGNYLHPGVLNRPFTARGRGAMGPSCHLAIWPFGAWTIGDWSCNLHPYQPREKCALLLMSEPYRETIEGAALARSAPGARHELICARLHACVRASVANFTNTRLLAPRSEIALKADTTEWQNFMDLADMARGEIPKHVLTDQELLKKLPVFFRSVRGAELTEKQLDELIKMVKELHTPDEDPGSVPKRRRNMGSR